MFEFGVLGFFTQPLSNTMNGIHCLRDWKHFHSLVIQIGLYLLILVL